jgi:hypothetical protein
MRNPHRSIRAQYGGITEAAIWRYFTNVTQQRYVSPDLTHFVGRRLKTYEARFALLKKIIRQGVIQARPHRPRVPAGRYEWAKNTAQPLSSNSAYSGPIACFCDIPLADMHLHMAKYGKFGIAFSKSFLADSGATPILYVPTFGRPAYYHSRNPDLPLPRKGVSSQAIVFDKFFDCFNRMHLSLEELRESNPSIAKDLQNMIGFLDPSLLSHIKFFDHRLPDDHPDNFYMEREWRTTKDVEFELTDIQRIVLPQQFSRLFRNAFRDYDGEIFFAD